MPAAVWLANIDNAHTRRTYKGDVEHFVAFCGIEHAHEFRQVPRAHVLAWRELLQSEDLAPATIRRKLSSVSSLYDYLYNKNAVENNPVAGVTRLTEGSTESKTTALSDAQAKALLQAPERDRLKSVRDRAILATYLFRSLRCSEVVQLRVIDMRERRGVMNFTVFRNGSKTRYVPVHPGNLSAI